MQISIKQIINAALSGDDLRIVQRAISAGMGDRYADPTASIDDINSAAVERDLEAQMADCEKPAFLSIVAPTADEVFAEQKKINFATTRMQSMFAELRR